MKKCLLFLGILCSPFLAKSQWVAGYSFKSQLTIDNSVVCGSSDLANFPVLIQLTGNFLRPSPTGLISNANGYDIIFTASDGTTILDHQIDHYVSSTGQYGAWVRIPTLSVSANTVIYMYYGNASISSDPSTMSTWTSNVKTVYHFQNNNFNDATTYAINSTNNGTTNATAKFGDGRDLDGASGYIQSNSSELKTDNDFTVSVWFKADATTPGHILWQGESSTLLNGWGTNNGAGESEMNLSMGLCCPGNMTISDNLSFYLGDREEEVNTDGLTAKLAFTNTTSWQHAVATVSSMSTAPVANLYLNGALVSTNTGVVSNVTDRTTWATNLRIGRAAAATRFFNGQVDEVRVYNTVLSADWVCTEYNNQNNGAFTTLTNHPATLATIEGTALAYTEDDAATVITSTLTATDWDNNSFASATVSITGNYLSTEDVLSFTTAFGISALWNSGTGVLTLTPTFPATTASIANFISALRAVRYQNTNNGNPSTATRTVQFRVFDGAVFSNIVSRDITLTSLNDAPVLLGTNAFTAINEDNVTSLGTLVSALVSGQVTDGDASAATGIAVTAVDNTNGTWQYTINGGTLWNNFGSPAPATARLLTTDASTLVRFVPNANWNGTATITYRAWDQTSGTAGNTASVVTNGGTTAFSSNSRVPSITVNAVNDIPVFTKGADQSVNEDAGAQSISGWATGIDDGDPELTQTLTFNVSNDNNTLFSVQPAVSAAGILTYTPAANANGTATVTVTLSDNGSNVAPNVNVTASQTFTITVNAVNDAPVFTKGANQSVNEDVGAQSISGWATGISDGDPELTQTLTFNVSNDNNPLFSVQPAVSATGVLTYTPAANANGTTTVTISLSDNGSNVAPNVNTSANQTFTITINAVNDVPVFTKGADETVNEDAGGQSISGWATGIGDGDPELTQTLTFNVSNNNNSLFSAQPAISATGVLTYTPAVNANGTATVTVSLSDNGSNVAPNVNTSANQTFTITVNAVNDIPVFTKGADHTVNEDAAAQTVSGWATGIGDGDPELTQTLTFNVSNDNNALFSGQPAISATGVLTYTPASNANGTTTVTVSLSDNGSNVAPNVNTSASQTFTITVSAVNDVPLFTKGADQSVNEDAGAQSISGWATGIGDGDPELVQTLTFNVSNNNNALFSAQPVVSATGVLTYTPAADANGTATVTVSLADNGSNVAPNVNTSANQTFVITVIAVNDVPVFTKGADQTVNEDVGAQSISGWATAITDGDPELTQTLTFNVSNDNNALFSAQPAISATGVLTYTPAANANGTATVTVSLSDNGSNVAPNVNTTTNQTFIITVNAVNDVPVFTKGANQSVNEDAAAQSVAGWATGITDGDPELSQVLTFNVSNDNNTLFSIQPAIDAITGNLTYTPAVNANGTATVTVSLSDNGSNVAPNVNTSANQTFTITVSAINDVPAFTKGADQAVNEDAGAQSISGWATGITDGDPELAQTLTFNVSNDNNTLFAAQPAISATGVLTYTPAANANGTATVTLSLSDNGSNVAPNVNTSASQTFTITVNAVNDVPVFTKGTDQVVNEDVGAQSISGWATGISDGDPELTQTLTFNVSNNDNALFSVQPAISATGVLTYTPAADVNGTATVTLSLSDNGSNVAPNVNTSASQTFTITINAINDVPVFTKGVDQSLNEDAGAQTIAGWATGIGDGDPELVQTLTFNVSNNNNPLFSSQPAIDATTGELTYTPAANANGTATVTLSLSDNGSNVAPNVNTSANQTFTITVNAVNDVPVFAKGVDQTVSEDAGAQSISGWATGINDGDPELTQTLTFNVSNDNNTLFSAQPAISATGVLTYTPAANANGTATVTVSLSDNGSNVAPNVNTSASQTFTITVNAVNDVPLFTKGADQTVNEDAAAQSVAGWATSISDGDPELAQTLTFNVSNDNNPLFSSQPAVSAAGVLTYTPAANANGTATVTITLSDNGSNVAPNVNTSASQTFIITVNAVNDIPLFTKGADQTVNEDAGAQSISGWATGIDDGDAELAQALTFNVSNDNNPLFSTQPVVSAAGVLTYTPAANANGTATVTVSLSDNGSNIAPNVNTSASQTFTITVNAVNDAPVFTKGPDESIVENAGAQSVPGWATGISDGDPELTQTLTFNVSNDNNALFSVQPVISATGTLTYTGAANTNGSATVTVTLSDNGSGVAPNLNTSVTQTFLITIGAVNDAPVFTKGADQSVNEDAGAQSAPGWATGISDGDPELIQTLTFNVSNDNNALFSSQPAISAAGVLTYTPAANANGTATVTVSLSDNGSNVAPNVNTSANQTFIITVNAVNDAPLFTKGADQVVNEEAAAQTVSGWATGISDGDPELTQTLTFNVSNDNNALFSAQPAISATGVLTYTPAANANGTATVTVSLSDNGSNVAPNVNVSANQTFTITVNAVNDVPLFTKGADQSLNEDAGAQTIAGWATGIGDGDPELAQILTFNVSNDNNSLFSSQPAIDASTGDLTYTPAAHANGTATITVGLSDNGSNVAPNVNTSANQTFIITVNAVNDVPVFTKGADQTVNEDVGAQSISGWATGISDGDPELTQTLTFNVSNDNNALFSGQPAISATGVLTYTPAANANGTATVTVSLSDNGSNVAPNVSTSASQTFTITVNAVNDVPLFTKGADQSVNEDAGAQSISGWATGIGDGDPELAQTLNFNVSNDNNTLFSGQPAISATGVLTYTPAANANGTATVTVSLSDNGSNVAPNVNTSANQTFIITVNAVNDVPVFTKGADQTVNEDVGAQSISGWATGIDDADAELTQTLTFNASNDNNTLFSAQPAISATGVLTYTPAANANGTATVTVSLSDNGSNIAPNVNTSANQTFVITVNAVNDAPVFTKGPDESIIENAGAQSVSGWATGISDGDPELTQTLTFNVSNDNNALFSVQPSISATGTLTYTGAANTNGSATVTITLSDNGSGVAPNLNTSVTQTFLITIGAVNDAPVFTKGADQSVNEDAGAQSISGWATGVSDGDPELVQTLAFNVSNDNNALFSVQTAISATGDLTYTPAVNANGTATVTVTLSDNGSNVAPNVNTSASQTFTVTVNAVNDVPVFTKGADQNVNEDAGAQSISGWATGINDGDPELAQTLAFNVSNDNNTLFTAQPAASATGVLTYTPAANANGTATVTVSLSDNGSNVAPNVNTSASQTFTITVNAINDVPVFAKGADQSVNEDAGAQSISGWATGISDGDPELTQTLTFNVSNNNNALFLGQPSIDALTGDLTYTPAADVNGTATVTVSISDNGSNVAPNVNTSANQTFIITVNAVNDIPSFTKGADQTVNEDVGAQSISGWATAITDGDPELTQTLTFNVSNDNNALFSGQPAISAAGVLTYTPAANANGTATVTVSLSDNGSNVAPNVSTSASQTFVITVNAVNDVPVFTKGADQSVNEDAGAQTAAGWATGIGDGDPELAQTLTFNASNDNNALFLVQPAISATGVLTYTPAANVNGTATVTVSLSDNGSNIAPNVNTSASQTFVITVNAINDVPLFTKGADQSVNEDAGAQTVVGWATGIGDGDPELTQTLTFNASNNNNALFSAQPAISATGVLTYTPAANANGTATVTLSLSDNGSNVAPNVNTSANQTFVITVNAVNDAPVFTKGPDESIIENAGAQSVPGWATGISDGDPELTQTLTFNVSNDNNALFSVQPSISATGTLTYTGAANTNGSATVTVTLSDNGSGVAPHVNTSVAQTFMITIGAVNDAPVFTKGADQSVNEDAGAQTIAGWATGISDGDPELVQMLTFSVSNDNNALFSAQPIVDAATGDLTYTPAANANGTATVTVSLSDNGSNVAPNVNSSASQTFTITVNAVNDDPVFTKGADQSLNEDAGPQTIAGWATGISDGDPELVQTLAFNVSNDNNALFSAQPVISAAGILTYTAAAHANGTATVTVNLSDNGSNVAPNVNISANQTFTITVNAVNDVPVFTKGADQSVNEDAAAQAIAGWATGISDGDPELAQVLTFNVSNNNNALFSTQPAIDATTGELTYTPAANANGTAIVAVSISDNGSNVAPNVNTSANQTFIITVNAVNDVPVFTKGADQSLDEDAGTQTISGWATGIGDSDPELTQTLTFNVSNDNNALFSAQPAISATGILTYTSAANANGTATVTVSLSDNGANVAPNINTSASQTFIITVNAVNDVPLFTAGANQSVNENAGAQTVAGWATGIGDGDPELAQTLTFNVSNDNNPLFLVQPAINGAGVLTYTAAANVNGSATVTVSLSDNGSNVAPNVNTSASQTFVITVSAVNDAPVFTKGADQALNEDASAQNVAGWATGIDDGDPELTQTLTFNVSNSNNALFSSQPVVDAVTGNLTYTLAADANGAATVTISLSDNGLNVAPNVSTSASQTFVITVNAVNDVPLFTKGANQTVNEDAGAQTVAAWATGIGDGDPELTQILTFNVSNDNNALFTTQPAISAAGVLTYTPAADVNGSATVTVNLSDNGSNVAPSVNTSASQTFVITVNAVNDVPLFTKGADQSLNEDAGPQAVSGWATGIGDGDPELIQTLTFNVSNDNNTLFSGQPAIDAVTGNLTYTLAADANGTATVTVNLSDNGSNVAPNVSTSANQTFAITVNAINDVPVFTKGADETVNEDAGAQSNLGWATGINDGDPELTQTLIFNVSNDNNALFSAQPAVSAAGVLTYTPMANANGTATVTVSISDDGSNVAPNVNTSVTQTFTISVNAVNDVPVFTKGADETVNEDTGAQSIPGWAAGIGDGDPELTQTLTFNISNDNNALFTVQPSVDVVTGDLTYTPAANANGTAIVTVSLSDNGSNVSPDVNTTASQTFMIIVNAVNDAPVAVVDSYTITEGGTINQALPGVLANDSDVDNGFTAMLVTTTLNGTVTLNADGSFAYTHDGSETLSDSFSYKVNDGFTDGNTVAVAITVVPQNDNPMAADDGATTPEDTQVAINVLANDSDSDNALDPATVTIVSSPLNGGVSINIFSGMITYMPATNYSGADSFSYTVRDASNAVSAIAVVNIVVMPVNDAPVASDDNSTTPQDLPVVVDIIQNDTDVDDSLVPSSIVIVTAPVNGTVSVTSGGTVAYTPASGYEGSDSFTYTVSDLAGAISNIATVNIVVTHTNRAPVAVDDGLITVVNTQPVSIDVLANDSDPDGTVSELTIVWTSGATLGTVVVDNGNIVYQAFDNISGDDSFTYIIRDAMGLTDTAVVYIHYEHFPLQVSEGFSPNGDGENDTWYIKSIENYPMHSIKVFDRWGMLVYHTTNYDNVQGWNGQANTGQESGKSLEEGTYYYLLNLGNKKVVSGYLTLVR